MGLRFRRSIKLAPGIKLNLGKKSVGVSVGGKYGGVSVNSRNGVHARASLPGTGLSYTTPNVGGSTSGRSRRGTMGLGKGVLIALLVIGAIASCGESDASRTTVELAAPTPTISRAEILIPDNAYVAGTKAELYHAADCDIVDRIPNEDMEQFLKPEDAEAAGYRPHQDCLPDLAANYIPPQVTPTVVESAVTYIASAESDKYHRPDCRWVDEIKADNLREFCSRADAEAAGLKPCGTCKP